MRYPIFRRLSFLVGTGMAVSCGGEESPPARVANQLTLVSGDGQTARVGELLPAPIVFRAGDAQGPLSGVRLTFTVEQAGGGFVGVGTDTTKADGTVQTTWALGGKLGTQALTAQLTTVQGVAPVEAHASATVGPVGLLVPLTDAAQFVVVGRSVPSPPAVKVTDAFGNLIANELVTFVDASGRTIITGGAQTSDANGRAAVGGWKLPNAAGLYVLTPQTVNGTHTSFTATGIPAAVRVAAGAAQTANAGTLVASRPAIVAVDDGNLPLANVSVTFTVTTGGGRLLGNAQKTDATGAATVGGWILGLAPGPNRLKAETPGVAPITFDATGVVAVPVAVAAIVPVAVSGFLGNYTAKRPAVRVTDAAGNPVAGAAVTFSGDGTLTGPTTSTDFTGEAVLGAWRLGAAAASQTVGARVGALPVVTFTATATAPPPSAFTIDVRYPSNQPTAAQRAAFDAAATRWQGIVLGDLSDEAFTLDVDDDFCGPRLDETIDDVVIFASLERIDGPGGVLGSAGPCFIRDDNGLTVMGRMRFDTDDLASLESSGLLNTVILHEMGHVLGIGSLWDLEGIDLLRQAGTADPFFVGGTATAAFLAAVPAFTGSIVPVEGSGGSGTRDSHWRETVLRNELMTGFVNQGANPLSAITIGSLRDEGYLVNDAVADDFSFLSAVRAASGEPAYQLREVPLLGPIKTLNRFGRVVRVLRRS
ncbi:MAG: leishmanolysin-related zinc metalloendopeptidase [Gemmatimonadota bacterium]